MTGRGGGGMTGEVYTGRGVASKESLTKHALGTYLTEATDEEVESLMSKSNTKAVRVDAVRVDDDVYGIIKSFADRNGVTVRAALRTLVLNDLAENEEDGVELPEGHWSREDSDPIGDLMLASGKITPEELAKQRAEFKAGVIKSMTPHAVIEDEPF